MSSIHQMIQTHPKASGMDDALAACIESCFECTSICTSCADACLGEQKPDHLTRCIRLNLDCADICDVTGRVVTRQTATEPSVIRAQLQACAEACRVCAEECEKHAGHGMEHCRVCAESCRNCERACNDMLAGMAA